MVLELPTPWAVSSAEPFARGGVGLLTATGVVDTLSFGGEAGRRPLAGRADCLASPAWQEVLARGWQRVSPSRWPGSRLLRPFSGTLPAVSRGPTTI